MNSGMDLNHKFSFPLLASALVGGATLVSLQAETTPAQTPPVAVKKAAKAKQAKQTDPEAKENKSTEPADSEEKESKETKVSDGNPSEKPTESEATEHEAPASGGGGGGTGGGEVTNAPSRGAGNSDRASFDFVSPWQGGAAPGAGSGGGSGGAGGSSRSAAGSRSSGGGGSASGVRASGGSGAGSHSGGSSSAGAVTVDSGGAIFYGARTHLVNSGILNLAGGAGTINSANHLLTTSSNTLTLPATATISNTAELALSQLIQGVGGITKTGTGLLTLSGVNTYTGLTQVNAGTLNVATTGVIPGGIAVSSGATLTGGGILGITGSGTSNTITLNGGTLAPGAGSGVGTLRLGSLVSNGGAINFDLGDASTSAYDQLNVTGSISLMGGLANFTLPSTPPSTLGNPFFLINNDGTDPISGSFSNLTEGSTVTIGGENFLVTYLADSETNSQSGGNDFALIPEPSAAMYSSSAANQMSLNFMAVPEPSSILLLGGLGLLWVRRRR